MHFLTDRTVGHGACFETFHDRFSGFHFFDRNGIGSKLKLKKAAKRAVMFGLVINRRGIFFEDFVILSPRGKLGIVWG